MASELLAGDGAGYSEYTYPPRPLALLAGVEFVLATLLFVPSERWAHWAGYALSGLLVTITALRYRHLERKGRAASPGTYVPSPRLNRGLAIVILLGLIVAVLHAWFLAQERRLVL